MSKPSILCAIDFTHASEEALQIAVEEANRRDAILDIVHVWYPAEAFAVDMGGMGVPVYDRDLPEHLRDQLEALEVDLPAERVRKHLLSGDAATMIAEQANKLDSQLLIVGTHSRGAVARWFVGSVVNELLRMAPCPLLVCRHTTRHSHDEPSKPSTSAKS